MSQLVLFEDSLVENFLPLVYWRGMFDLRCGRKSLLDNVAWELAQPVTGIWTRDWIADLCAIRCQTPVNRLLKNGAVLVNARWLMKGNVEFNAAPYVARCGESIAYIACDEALAKVLSPEMMLDSSACKDLFDAWPSGEVEADLLEHPWELVARNEEMLKYHWSYEDRVTDGVVSHSAFVINPDYVHISDRSEVRPTAVINAEKGPVYISNDVLVDVHTYIEGPAYIGAGCVIKPHASVREGTTLGSLSIVAGEISNSILAGYANKGHHGFLGQAYVGSWVNLGAGTTNSTVKSTYGTIRVQMGDKAVDTGRQFFGSIIGDFARLGIGQLLPTGSVVGFGAMLANGGIAPKYVPSLAWLTSTSESRTDIQRLVNTFKMIMGRRKVALIDEELDLLARIPDIVSRYGV